MQLEFFAGLAAGCYVLTIPMQWDLSLAASTFKAIAAQPAAPGRQLPLFAITCAVCRTITLTAPAEEGIAYSIDGAD
jgi:hypothetical protein